MIAEQPWPEVEYWPIVSGRRSQLCQRGSHGLCGGYVGLQAAHGGARCGCTCHAGLRESRPRNVCRAYALTDSGRQLARQLP